MTFKLVRGNSDSCAMAQPLACSDDGGRRGGGSLSSKLRGTDLSMHTTTLTKQLAINIEPISEISKTSVQKQVYQAKCQGQYKASALRQEWLEANARNVA
jgi:hypothetical protein